MDDSVLKTIASPDGRQRVLIVRREDGFCSYRQQWLSGEMDIHADTAAMLPWETGAQAEWGASGVGPYCGLYDSPETAEKEAFGRVSWLMALQRANVSAYFARINYSGAREPTLAVLRGIVAAHATSIPFENIDVLLGRGVRLDGESVMEKLVARRRGGYCFEHNGLLREVLTALGFPVEGLAARVLWNRPVGELGPRGHMLLRVVLTDGEFIADVGFGGLTLTAPLRLKTGLEQATPHEPHRLVPVHGETELQALLGGDWIPLYRFAMTPQLPIDYELANWFTATHPASPFPNELMMARPDTDRRFALLDRKFTTRHRDGRVERRELQDAADLGAVLVGDFKLALPEGDVAAVWERIAAAK